MACVCCCPFRPRLSQSGLETCSPNQGQCVYGYWKLVPRAQTQSGGPCNVAPDTGHHILSAGTSPCSDSSLVLTLWVSSEALPCCLHTQLQGPTSEALIWNPLELRCAPPQSSGQLPTWRTGLHGTSCFLPCIQVPRILYASVQKVLHLLFLFGLIFFPHAQNEIHTPQIQNG